MLRIIIILVALLVVLGLFGIDVRKIADNPKVRSNVEYVTKPVVEAFNKYIKPNFMYFWDNVFAKKLWQSFNDGIENIKNGEYSNPPQQYEAITPNQ